MIGGELRRFASVKQVHSSSVSRFQPLIFHGMAHLPITLLVFTF